jgi:hypothetical protein
MSSARCGLEQWVYLLVFILFELILTTFDTCSLGHAAVLEPIGFIAGFQDVAMVGEAIQ